MSSYAKFGFEVLFLITLSTAIGWFSSQLFKAILNTLISKTYTFRYFMHSLFTDGDFPSSHTCCSVCAYIVGFPFLIQGISLSSDNSSSVACTAILLLWSLFTFFTVKDSVSVRGALKNISIKNKKICDHMEQNVETYSNDSTNVFALQEFWTEVGNGININVGHMPHETIGGLFMAIFLGLGINSLYWNITSLLFIDLAIFVAYLIITTYVLTHKKNIFTLLKSFISRKK